MSSVITWGDQNVWVANQVLARLLDFAVDVGTATASDADEMGAVDNLTGWREKSYFSGVEFDLDVVFPTIDEKKMWARCFNDLARRVFLRTLGKHDTNFWQSETIAVAHLISRWLTSAVQAHLEWFPDTEDKKEAAAWNAERNST